MSSERKPTGTALAEWPEWRDVARGENPVRAALVEESRCIFFSPRPDPTGPLVAAVNPEPLLLR